MKNLISTLFLTLALSLGVPLNICAQDPAAGATEEQKKEKEENEKKAFVLLDQVVNEAQMLRLAENRIRVQIGAADLLWTENEGRARSLFSLAAEGVAEMMRSTDNSEQRRGPNLGRSGASLRQELVLTVANHDAPLAYQLLAATRQLNPPADQNNTRRFDSEQNLEEALLAQVAALDPEFALRNAEQLLDKGEYSRSLSDVLKHLQRKDKEAALKLEDRIVKKLRSENLVSNSDAGGLALNLLQAGPRLIEDNSALPSGARQPVLGASSYQDLMVVSIEAALKATPPPATAQQRQATPRGRGNQGRNAARPNTPQAQQNQLTDAQNEQRNATRLLAGFRSLLPLVDQYVPARSTALRQKFSELGMVDNARRPAPRPTQSQTPTSDSLFSAASLAPPAAQSRIYQQAAMRALAEGNPERAKQIANDYLEEGRKQSVLQTIELRQLAARTEATRIDEVRNALASLPSDAARVDLLMQLVDSVRKKSPGLAIELLDQAREFTNKRATGYEQFEIQLRVAAAFRDLESSHGFDVLEPGVMQLNELLSAAAVLSGFEVNVFREGEMPLQGGSRLGDIVRRYSQEIGRLGKKDFQRAEMLASRFQFAEPRIVARLALVRSLLGIETAPAGNNRGRTGFFSMDGIRL